MVRARRERTLAPLGLLLAACGGAAGTAEVVPLAELYRPPDGLIALADGGRAFEQAFDVPAEGWKEERAPGLWSVRAPWYGGPLPVLRGERARLVLDGDMALRPAERPRVGSVDAVGEFALVALGDGDHVFARLPPGTRPGAGRLTVRVSAGAPGRERAGGARAWRLAGGHLAADGFLVRADAPAELRVDVPPEARLVFDAACVGYRTDGPVTLAVRLDGETLAELELPRAPVLEARPREVALPADGRPGARLSFAADGDAWTALLEPRLVPVDPPEPARPDVVVFLADTFRADNLALHGGPDRPAGLTPELDAFADESLRVRRVWSPACWTLPSHASMFLGVAPLQHGAVEPRLTPASGLTSVAERLRDAGYRTAAVTDGLFVSRRFELDRGFERFEEHRRRGADREHDLERTLRRARELAARDDGRPLFLFVHTYRTHEPYAASAETRAELGDALGLGPTWDELAAAVNDELLRRARAGDAEVGRLAQEGDLHELLVALGLDDPQFLAEVRALYLGGVRDLDRAFGAFVRDLDRRDREAFVVFTSDHGEAFGEHDSIFHGFGAWEENLRVPLLIRGPGVAPRTVEHPATLVDLPQTLAELAGVAPDPAWGGASLLSLERDRPIFAFDCAQRGEPSGALLEDGLKVIFPPEEAAIRAGAAREAYDLDTDPFEREDLAGEPRARTALERLAEDALERMRPVAPPGEAALDAGHLEAMEAMGYAGGGEDDSE